MIGRHVSYALRKALDRQATVALIGPRQVGKTTLALDITEKTGALYLDLEASADRYPVAEDVEAIGLREMASILRKQ